MSNDSHDQTTAQCDNQLATTGADAVIRALETAGVEHLFGVQGGAIMPVYDALYDSEITHVTMAHEQGAAHAADAYNAVSGNTGVCLATSGPGATNLVTGLADSHMDSKSVLALTGQAPSGLMGRDAFQEVDTAGMTRPITKANMVATDPDTVGEKVSTAFELTKRGRQGPVLIDLPKDVTNATVNSTASSLETPATCEPPEQSDSGIVAEAAKLLARADKPLILAGGGVIKADAAAKLREFATEYRIPVITTMPGIGAFPEDHELSMGVAGMYGTSYANMAVTMTDCLLAIGTRFDNRLTGDVGTFAPDAKVIHADIDPAEFSKNVHTDYPLCGDAGAVLEQLYSTMPHAPNAAPWIEQCGTWKAEYPMDCEIKKNEPIKPQYVVEQLDAATPDDTIVTTGGGQHQMWASQYWTYTEPYTWVSSHGLGTMGYGLPAAIGAKVAAPDRNVVCFEGDRSFLMTCQELAVAVRENLDITVAVLDTSLTGMVRHSGSHYPWVPAFDKLAEAFGAKGFSVREYDEVVDTIETALAYDGPSVIDFQ